MANYQLGPIIGKIGGADVEVIEVSATGLYGAGEVHELATIPTNGPTLVAFIGEKTGDTSTFYPATLRLGDQSIETVSNGEYGLVMRAEEVVTVDVLTARAGASDSVNLFGHIYAVPIPD